MYTYKEALEIAHDLFAEDNVFAMATTNDQLPSVRMVDVYLDNNAFYMVTHSSTQKVKEIEINPNVSLSKGMHRFFGVAHNLGHPFKAGNEAIRAKIAELLPNRHFNRLDKDDESLVILRVDLSKGFFHKDGLGFDINFNDETLETYEFQVDMYL